MPKVEIILIPPNKKVEIFLPERLTLVEKILPLFQQNGKETLNPHSPMNTVLSYLLTITLMYGNLFFIVVNFHKVVDGSANTWIYSLNILSLILLVQLSKRQSKS